MSERTDFETWIESISDDDTIEPQHTQQELPQQHCEASLQQLLVQKQVQIEQLESQLKQQKLQIERLQQHQIKCPQRNLGPIPEQQQPQQTPFKIVLIDIQQAARQVIRCVEKPLTGNEDLKYVALSYRWGDLHETMVNTGLDYIATVKSFRLNDFFVLCQAMMKETDLQHMKYVWVDAICVDQSNYERKKATIYQMSNIYKRANYIVAVPDLHVFHRITTSISESYHNDYIEAHDELIFRFLNGNADQLLQTDYEHDDGTNIPTVLSKENYEFRNAILFLVDLIIDWLARVWVISECNIARSKNVMKYWFIQLNRRYSYNDLQPEPGSYYFDEFSFFEFDFHRLEPTQLQINTLPSDTDEVTEWKKDLKTYYLEMQTRMFHPIIRHQFLEKILKAKASKNADRFHAVLPSSKYDHIVVDKDIVDSWGITDLTSCKLKLFEFMDVEDKLKLLFLSGSHFTLCSVSDDLPTFATSTIFWPTALNVYFYGFPFALGGNFNEFDDTSITIKPTGDNYGGGYKLNIKPRQYFEGFGKSLKYLKYKFSQQQLTNAKRLGLDDPGVSLQVVYIPFFYFDSARAFVNEYYGTQNDEDVQYILLVGNFERNIWVLHRGYELYLDTKEVKMGYSFDTEIGFDIY